MVRIHKLDGDFFNVLQRLCTNEYRSFKLLQHNCFRFTELLLLFTDLLKWVTVSRAS